MNLFTKAPLIFQFCLQTNSLEPRTIKEVVKPLNNGDPPIMWLVKGLKACSSKIKAETECSIFLSEVITNSPIFLPN